LHNSAPQPIPFDCNNDFNIDINFDFDFDSKFDQVIHHVLRPGGYWINLGPLLWHWADAGPEHLSLELPLAEVHRVARLMGFEAVRHEFVDAAYIGGWMRMRVTVVRGAERHEAWKLFVLCMCACEVCLAVDNWWGVHNLGQPRKLVGEWLADVRACTSAKCMEDQFV
jgi:hypothetical protein